MTQDAVVTRVFPNGLAEVAVTRGTACGSNCGNCESCAFQNELKAIAKNTVHATPGEKVVIESVSSRIFSAAFLLYIVPFIALFIGYAIAAVNALSEGMCILVSFAAFALAVAAVVVYQRINKRKKPITFEITQLR
ncbi:MAG: SoxR reducing system RseC family protein [Oscillospiraceae bacterium]|nr:SoxR reducing system RseC family protein [Oscillospiraceae bacterium]